MNIINADIIIATEPGEEFKNRFSINWAKFTEDVEIF